MTFLKASLLSLSMLAVAMPALAGSSAAGMSRQDRIKSDGTTETGASLAVKTDAPNEMASKRDVADIKVLLQMMQDDLALIKQQLAAINAQK